MWIYWGFSRPTKWIYFIKKITRKFYNFLFKKASEYPIHIIMNKDPRYIKSFNENLQFKVNISEYKKEIVNATNIILTSNTIEVIVSAESTPKDLLNTIRNKLKKSFNYKLKEK